MSNVISIFSKKPLEDDEDRRPDAIKEAFEEIIEKNRQVRARMEEMRRKNNEKVKREYHLKPRKGQ